MVYFWATIPQFIPFDGQLCWVRVKYYYSNPFLATWDETNKQFISLFGSIIYPAWSISRWRENDSATPISFVLTFDQTPVNPFALTMAGWKYFGYSIDWGDNSVTSGYFTGENESFLHTYAAAADYNVTFNFFSPSLTYFSLVNEPISGAMPDITVFKTLTYFNFSEVNLTGTWPTSMPFPFITVINLRYDELTGSIPDLSECVLLSIINGRNNSLSGPPPSFTANVMLTDIRLQFNSLSGSIPDLTGLTLLSIFQVSDNDFTGSIPDLTDCIVLSNCNVSNNNLSGNIPSLTTNVLLAQIVVSGQAISGYTASTISTTLTSFLAIGCALVVASVNQILADFVTNLAARPAAGTINLSGGTNAAPTGQGLIDKAAIQAHGWTVTTN
jgi:hypothetical protein